MNKLKLLFFYLLSALLAFAIFYLLKIYSSTPELINQTDSHPFYVEQNFIIALISLFFLIFLTLVINKLYLKNTSEKQLFTILFFILFSIPNFFYFKFILNDVVGFKTINTIIYQIGTKENIKTINQDKNQKKWIINKIVTTNKDIIYFNQNKSWEKKLYSTEEIKSNFTISKSPFSKYYILINKSSY